MEASLALKNNNDAIWSRNVEILGGYFVNFHTVNLEVWREGAGAIFLGLFCWVVPIGLLRASLCVRYFQSRCLENARARRQ